MRVNLKDVSTGFEPIPAGEYEATVTKAEFIAKSDSSGKPYIKVEFTLNSDEYPGRKQWKNYSLQPKALFSIKRDCLRMGIDESLVNDPDGIDTDDIIQAMLGQSCVIAVEVGEYEGKPKNDVTEVVDRESW